MNSPSDDRGRVPAVRMAGIGLGVLGAVGGIAGWFTLAGTADVTLSLHQVGGTSVAVASSVGQASGPAHTRTGGS